MNSTKLPGWVKFIAGLILAGQAGALGLRLAHVLQGPAQNLVPQAVLGGAFVLIVLAAWLLRFRADAFPPAPSGAGIVFLALFALVLVGIYLLSMRNLLTMPYDLASWSEPMFIVDVIKLRTGAPLYLPPGDSNSNTYTFLAPVLTYELARLAGHRDSIPVYRIIQQLYLALAAWLAALSTVGLLQLVKAEAALRLRRLWFPFFFFTSFLVAINHETGVFNIYLHNDPLALLVSTLAFWLLMKHAVSRDDRWLWVMWAIPAVAFLAKQNLGLWAAIYVIYLWLDGSYSLRTILKFAAASFGGVAMTVLACIAVWGQPFRYWVFQVMGGHVLQIAFILDRFKDGGWYIALGLGGILVLLRGEAFTRLLGIAAAWFLLLAGALYTSGIAFRPSHLGPLSMISGCFSLAALAKLWPAEDPPDGSRSQAWLSVVVGCASVALIFAALRFTEGRGHPISSDFLRYTHAIEQEFAGLPPERVLLDDGDWIYLRSGVVMRDRQPILATHRDFSQFNDMLNRARARYYSRILTRVLENGRYSYDIGRYRGIGPELLKHYREVRRIPHAEGMDSWLYRDILLSDVAVLEPLPPDNTAPGENAAGNR